MSLAKELCDKALSLDPISRVELAEILLGSIEVESDSVRQAWIEEVERRMSEKKQEFLTFEHVFDR